MNCPDNHRDIVLSGLKIVDSLGNNMFPDEIKILSCAYSSDGYTKLTIDRPLNKNNSDGIVVSGTLGIYDGDYAINNLAVNKLSFDIMKDFTVDATGILSDTGNVYSDDSATLSNFPALIIEEVETSFERTNTKDVIVKNSFVIEIVDRLDNHKCETERETLKQSKKFVWDKMIEFYSQVSKIIGIDIESDGLTVFLTIIDGKKCAVAMSNIEIMDNI